MKKTNNQSEREGWGYILSQTPGAVTWSPNTLAPKTCLLIVPSSFTISAKTSRRMQCGTMFHVTKYLLTMLQRKIANKLSHTRRPSEITSLQTSNGALLFPSFLATGPISTSVSWWKNYHYVIRLIKLKKMAWAGALLCFLYQHLTYTYTKLLTYQSIKSNLNLKLFSHLPYLNDWYCDVTACSWSFYCSVQTTSNKA